MDQDITKHSAARIAEEVGKRMVSAREVVEEMLVRVGAVNPTLNAVCTLNDAALDEADADVEAVARAERLRTDYWHRVRALLERHEFIITPAVGAPPFRLDRPLPDEVGGRKVERYYDIFLTAYAFSVTGLPAMSIPCGFTSEGLPVGLQVVGPRLCEDLLLRFAASFGAAHPEHFRTPEIYLAAAKPIEEAFSSPGLVVRQRGPPDRLGVAVPVRSNRDARTPRTGGALRIHGSAPAAGEDRLRHRTRSARQETHPRGQDGARGPPPHAARPCRYAGHSPSRRWQPAGPASSCSISCSANVGDGFAGSPADWETAFEGLSSSLADLPDCRIPVEMLQAAVRYTRTGDERHLLRLPLEQRQLLEDVLPAGVGGARGERAAR